MDSASCLRRSLLDWAAGGCDKTWLSSLFNSSNTFSWFWTNQQRPCSIRFTLYCILFKRQYFLHVWWPKQQCQSIEGGRSVKHRLIRSHWSQFKDDTLDPSLLAREINELHLSNLYKFSLNQLPSSFCQPHCVHSSPGSPHPAHVTSSQSSPSFSPSVTPSTFHSRLKTHLFHKSFPP